MDDPYVYPGTDVLRNKGNFRNHDGLERFERLMTAQRIRQGLPHVEITPDGYRRLHHHLFQDVYDWAGEFRTCPLEKNNQMFAFAQFVEGEIEKRFEFINAEDDLHGLTADQFAARASEHICELNAIHPFREGNGRTMRAFLQTLAKQAGHEIDLVRIDAEAWNEASIKSFYEKDYRPMQKVIAGALVEQEHEHQHVQGQEQGDSREPALDDTLTTAEKDAKDVEARVTSGELSDDKQAKVGRLSSEATPDTGSTPDQGQGKGRPQGGGRSRGRR